MSKPYSNFNDDLSKEQILAAHLDGIYQKLWKSSTYRFKRENDINLQHKGVDFLLYNNSKQFYVDEKAQLDYINHSLPTFAFEISYLKNNSWREGWLFDKEKKTDIYFLVTSIKVSNDADINSGITSLKIHGVYRNRLIQSLALIGLHQGYFLEIEKSIRVSSSIGRIEIPELSPNTEGFLFYSKTNKVEQPINLVLRLDYLVKIGCGKLLFNG